MKEGPRTYFVEVGKYAALAVEELAKLLRRVVAKLENKWSPSDNAAPTR